MCVQNSRSDRRRERNAQKDTGRLLPLQSNGKHLGNTSSLVSCYLNPPQSRPVLTIGAQGEASLRCWNLTPTLTQAEGRGGNVVALKALLVLGETQKHTMKEKKTSRPFCTNIHHHLSQPWASGYGPVSDSPGLTQSHPKILVEMYITKYKWGFF